ncbi:pyridoxamine 5'-phosphate oxidase family protein [Nocardiopsis salina]|uniref:pyridoxamine 5'-phosphate oxidase family protein n=1 Tax=Nocardiopsis salina TaxID=245836 RepID=UPI0012697667|nr:pyridoxamine 5'-phosphate oxidase family protein [Nocardiopsis salina]
MTAVPTPHPLTDQPAWNWVEALTEFTATTPTYWLTVSGTDGRPHTRPILAVWSHGALCFACSPESAKHRLLNADPRVSLGFTSHNADAVVEGTAERLVDHDALTRVSAAYAERYGWAPVPGSGQFTGPEGAPTAGSPPYRVFAVYPTAVYTFPASETAAGATRFAF